MNEKLKVYKSKDSRLEYYKEGNGQVIIFLHGWGQSKDSFINTFNVLKENNKCISVDLPGHGQSKEPNKTLDLNEYADTMINFFKEEKIENPIVIAHSFGVRVSIKMIEKGFKFKAFVFTGGAGIKPKRTFKQNLKVYHYKLLKKLAQTPLYWQYMDDLKATSGSEDYKNASEIMKKVLVSVVNEDLKNNLNKIDVPTLLFWGKNDDATPIEDAYVFKKEILKSKLVEVEGTHFAFIEFPIQFNEEIEKFLKGGIDE